MKIRLKRVMVRSRVRAFFPVLALGIALANAQGASACPYWGQGNSKLGFIGGYQDPSSTPYQVNSYITYDNPSPVFTTSSIWNMLTVYGTSPNYAQTGWIHYNGSTSPWVFWEDCTPSSCRNPVYAYVNPSGETQYFMTQWLNPGFAFWWNESYAVDYSMNFTPQKIQTYGEIHDYSPPNPIALGTHAAGNTSTKVHVYSISWNDANANVHAASLTYDYNSSYHPSASYQSDSTSASSFYTWDSRYNCNY
jgi:hypothetical protein